MDRREQDERERILIIKITDHLARSYKIHTYIDSRMLKDYCVQLSQHRGDGVAVLMGLWSAHHDPSPGKQDALQDAGGLSKPHVQS